MLRKGRDPAKDQSYFLYDLSEEQLAGARFPVGELSKAEVRAMAPLATASSLITSTRASEG